VILLVVNSYASSVTARNRVVIQKALAGPRRHGGGDQPARPRHPLRPGRRGAGIDVVVALGGDGTLNEVANGLAGTDTALAPLPGRLHQRVRPHPRLPERPVEAVALLADAGSTPQTSAGRPRSVNGRYFCFHTGVGFDAAVVEAVERRASLKRWPGTRCSCTPGSRHLAAPLRPARATLRGAHPTASGRDGYFTIVLNTNPYTFLGNRPLDLAAAATLDRGLVAVTHSTLRARAIIGSA
jgi:diacylglycerol kinase family enzyme